MRDPGCRRVGRDRHADAEQTSPPAPPDVPPPGVHPGEQGPLLPGDRSDRPEIRPGHGASGAGNHRPAHDPGGAAVKKLLCSMLLSLAVVGCDKYKEIDMADGGSHDPYDASKVY